MKPPAEVFVGPVKFTVRCNAKATREVRKTQKEKELAGLCQLNSATITIAHDLTPDLKRETLLHEIIHAVYAIVGTPLQNGKANKSDREELAVAALSPMLLWVLRENPEVVDYLLGGGDE